MSEVDNEDDNLLVLLYRHNLGHVIENIVEYAGHTATVNMLCACKSWLAILNDIVPLRRLVFLRSVRDRNFARLCRLNRWTVAPPGELEDGQQMDHRHLAYINYTSTDLRKTIKRYGVRTQRPHTETELFRPHISGSNTVSPHLHSDRTSKRGIILI